MNNKELYCLMNKAYKAINEVEAYVMSTENDEEYLAQMLVYNNLARAVNGGPQQTALMQRGQTIVKKLSAEIKNYQEKAAPSTCKRTVKPIAGVKQVQVVA